MATRGVVSEADAVGAAWWWFLVTGVTWLLISLILFRFDLSSITTVGVLFAFLLLAAGVNEFVISAVRRAWRWFHVVMGVLFVIGGVWCLVRPIGGAVELASILGFLLLLKGSLDLIVSVTSSEGGDLSWVGAIVGVLEILLAFWVSQSFIQTRLALLVLWVGFAALFRGFSEIVLAFQLRAAARALSPV